MHIIFRVFNFRIAHAIRKYFNNENFTIYGMYDWIRESIAYLSHYVKEPFYMY